MSLTELRPVWGAPGLYWPSDGMVQTPGGSGFYDPTGFDESAPGSGLYLFTEIPATAATITPHLEGNPWVEVYFPQLDPSTTRLTVFRYSDGRTWKVRGGVDIVPGVPVQDFEIPFGVIGSYSVESNYRAQMFAADGSDLGFTNPVSISIAMPRGFASAHQVLDPSLWAPVRVMAGSADSLLRRTPGDLVYAEGASVPRRIGKRREALSSLALTLYTDTLDAADAFQSALGDYNDEQVGVLCLRTAPPIRIPRTLFVASDEIDEKELNLPTGGQDIFYTFTGDEVEPPYPGLVVPLLTYDDIDASFATYDDEDAAFATYTDRDRAYELAGAAG